METKVARRLDVKEILLKLAKLQEDIDYIKSRIKSEESRLKSEIIEWEEASVEDTSNFLEKYNL